MATRLSRWSLCDILRDSCGYTGLAEILPSNKTVCGPGFLHHSSAKYPDTKASLATNSSVDDGYIGRQHAHPMPRSPLAFGRFALLDCFKRLKSGVGFRRSSGVGLSSRAIHPPSDLLGRRPNASTNSAPHRPRTPTRATILRRPAGRPSAQILPHLLDSGLPSPQSGRGGMVTTFPAANADIINIVQCVDGSSSAIATRCSCEKRTEWREDCALVS